jgi:hypothetical protein
VQLSFESGKRDENGNLFLLLRMDMGLERKSVRTALGYAKKRIMDLTGYKEGDEEGKGYTFLSDAEVQHLQK